MPRPGRTTDRTFAVALLIVVVVLFAVAYGVGTVLEAILE